MGEIRRDRYLTRHDLESVIRRAAELESQAGSTVPELSEADVLRIAHEVGLSEQSIRRALLEHRASTASDNLLAEHGWLSRLCGPGLVRARRRIDRPADELRSELESHFQTNESLRLLRRTGVASLWEPDRGVVASIVRGVDLFGRGYQLAKKGQAIEVDVVELEEQSCQVTITADISQQRAGWFWGLGIAAGAAAVAGASLFIVGLPSAPDAAALGTPALLGFTLALARRGYRRVAARMHLVLEGLLDRLEHDEPLEPPRAAWRDLLK